MVWVPFLAHVKEPCAFSQDFFSLEETVSDMEMCGEIHFNTEETRSQVGLPRYPLFSSFLGLMLSFLAKKNTSWSVRAICSQVGNRHRHCSWLRLLLKLGHVPQAHLDARVSGVPMVM